MQYSYTPFIQYFTKSLINSELILLAIIKKLIDKYLKRITLETSFKY